MKIVVLSCVAILGMLIVQTSAMGQVTLPKERKDLSREIQTRARVNVPVIRYQSLSPTVKASIERPDEELRNAAMRGLQRKDRSRLELVVRQLKSGNQAAGQREWQSMISDITARRAGPSLDVSSLVQHVLRQSYVEANRDLQGHAEKIRYYNEVKEALRSHITDIRGQYTQWTSQSRKSPIRTQPQTVKVLRLPSTVSLPLDISHIEKAIRTKIEWEAYLDELEEELDNADDDGQLANIDLQNAMQKQQQTLQTMSSVSKMLHDTAMAIIRKIG